MLSCLTLVGCHTYQPVPQYDVSLAGAQVAVEYVQSWLRAADSTRFNVTQVSPINYSGTGFDHLLAGRCDLACTDRPIRTLEAERAPDRDLAGHRIAFFGYALYVHPSNPLDSVFSKHVSLVYQQQITDWSQLAGRQIDNFSGPINLYGPSKSTRGGMVLSPLANIWFAEATWQVCDSDAEIIDRVANDPLGLGFASIGYDEGVRYLGLRMRRYEDPAFPSIEEIESERYGLAKVFYVYHRTPASPAVQTALDYLFSPAGQRAIEDTEVWPIPRKRAGVPLPVPSDS